eukprot:jgi/Botrbrau1/7943/Bobra.9_2s0101.1
MSRCPSSISMARCTLRTIRTQGGLCCWRVLRHPPKIACRMLRSAVLNGALRGPVLAHMAQGLRGTPPKTSDYIDEDYSSFSDASMFNATATGLDAELQSLIRTILDYNAADDVFPVAGDFTGFWHRCYALRITLNATKEELWRKTSLLQHLRDCRILDESHGDR